MSITQFLHLLLIITLSFETQLRRVNSDNFKSNLPPEDDVVAKI